VFSDVLVVESERHACFGGDGTASEACSDDDVCTYPCSVGISWTCSVYAELAADGVCRGDMLWW
jgi:hypothetical protein